MGLKIIMMGNSIFINNPFNRVLYDNQIFSRNTIKQDIPEVEPEEDENAELYREEDYFSRAPRLMNEIEHEEIKIDPPPAKQKIEEMPLLYVVGSMLSMGMMSMVSVYTAIDGLATGTRTFKQALPSLLMGVAMLCSMIVFPTLNKKYEKKKKLKYEAERQQKYGEYIVSKSMLIDEIVEKQRRVILENYNSAAECQELILTRNRRLWERKIGEHDFLTVRLGTGNMPLDIDIKYPEETFAMEEDNLAKILQSFANKSKILKNVPITLSLFEKRISAIIAPKDKSQIDNYVQSLLIQLVTFHSYENLKLVFLVNRDKQKSWEYAKMLPHIWDNMKQIRFFTDDYNDMKEISMYLEKELQERLPKEDEQEENKYTEDMAYYLIITDDYKKVGNLQIITDVLKAENNIGFSILFISNSLTQLPNECKTFINIEGTGGMMFESEGFYTNQKQFTIDGDQLLSIEKACRILMNIPIRYQGGKYALPSLYTFLEMYNARTCRTFKFIRKMEDK